MANFARLIDGEWRVTLASGAEMFQAWQWGPGRFSIHRLSRATEAGGVWAGDVMYWHPGRKEVRLLSLHEDIPGVGRGVGEGAITFAGTNADAVLDLRQPRGPRRLTFHWLFDGADRYDEPLLEDSGSGPMPLNKLTFVRVPARAATLSHREPLRPSGRLRAFDAFLGAWDTRTGDGTRARSTFEWVPSLEIVRARTVATTGEGVEPSLRLDVTFYAPIEPGPVRCLALSSDGSVFEGGVTEIEGGAMHLELEGDEGDRVTRRVVRLEVEQDGTLHQRTWSVRGADRTIVADVHHEKAVAND